MAVFLHFLSSHKYNTNFNYTYDRFSLFGKYGEKCLERLKKRLGLTHFSCALNTRRYILEYCPVWRICKITYQAHRPATFYVQLDEVTLHLLLNAGEKGSLEVIREARWAIILLFGRTIGTVTVRPF